MTTRPLPLLALLGILACGGDTGGVSPDAIRSAEKAAVQNALDCALSGDTLFPYLTQFALPYLDRASFLVTPAGDTTRVAGLQILIDATIDSTPVVAQLSGVLAWTGFDSAAATVDTTVFLIGAGATALPLVDSLRPTWSPITAGSGTGYVIHMTSPATCEAWLARAGALTLTGAAFGAGNTQTIGTVRLTVARGTVSGELDITAKLVPDSSTTVTSDRLFDLVQGIRISVAGTVPAP
jgi:hypothetical protein